jgi:hypothetical protein
MQQVTGQAMPAAPAAASAGGSTMQVMCPPDGFPGKPLQIMANGQPMTVQIPQGAQPNQPFTIQVPVSTKP